MVAGAKALVLALAAISVLFGSIGCASTNRDAAQARWASAENLHYMGDRPQRESTAGKQKTVDSLESLLSLAESANPGLRGAFDQWTAALEQVPQATSLPDPKISYSYFVESVETRVGPQRQKFGVSQTIPLFGKLGLRGDIATNGAEAVGSRFEAARRELRFRLTELWNEYYYLNRAISATDESVRLLTYFESVALSQYTAGAASHSDVIRAQVELGRLEDRLLRLRDQQTPILAALNAELGRAQDTPIPWPDSIDTSPLTLSEEALQEALVEMSPQLQAVSHMAAKASAATTLAGRGPVPDLTIGAEYVDTDDARFPNVLDSGKDAVVAMATVNIPLWFGRYRAEQAEAHARQSAVENEYDQLRNRLLADLARAHFEYRDADRRVDLYAFSLLPKARQSLEVSENSFATGKTDFLALVDAQRTLLEFELASERALADRATMKSKLEQITGLDFGTQTARGGVER